MNSSSFCSSCRSRRGPGPSPPECADPRLPRCSGPPGRARSRTPAAPPPPRCGRRHVRCRQTERFPPDFPVSAWAVRWSACGQAAGGPTSRPLAASSVSSHAASAPGPGSLARDPHAAEGPERLDLVRGPALGEHEHPVGLGARRSDSSRRPCPAPPHEQDAPVVAFGAVEDRGALRDGRPSTVCGAEPDDQKLGQPPHGLPAGCRQQRDRRGQRDRLGRERTAVAQEGGQRPGERDGEGGLALQEGEEVVPLQAEQVAVAPGANRGPAGRVGEQRQLSQRRTPVDHPDHDRFRRLEHHLEPPGENDVEAVGRLALAEQPLARLHADGRSPCCRLRPQLRFRSAKSGTHRGVSANMCACVIAVSYERLHLRASSLVGMKALSICAPAQRRRRGVGEAAGELVEWIPEQGPLPELDGFGAAMVFGGAMEHGQETAHPWLGPEKDFLRGLLARGLPLLGVCLGAQLLAEAAGAPHRAHGRRSAGIAWR